ncbi:MAG: DNA-deoxyinosine glycosylase, partial [Eggerthellaceae bacterium]|nr:DNA-deoxyinosine glycosylase [Eggerthellaceae bacterium]
DERSRVLVLGSLPSPKSRELGFNYGHPQNRFWRVMAQLTGEPVPSTNDRKRDFCLRHHIALWDVVAECDIEGASDSSIRNARANDLALITQAAPIEAVFCTGTKAFGLYNKLACEAATGLPAQKLPSTSPANAAANLEQLCQAYEAIFEHTHEFQPPELSVPDVVALEQAIAVSGTPLSELMDRAGAAVAHRAEGILAELAHGTYHAQIETFVETDLDLVTVLCGNGNNGGDGWVAAELLAKAGHHVCLVTAKLPEDIKAQPAHDAAVRAAACMQDMGGRMVERGEELPFDEQGNLADLPLIVVNPDSAALAQVINRTRVVVDAMLGTGFSAGSVREPFCSWMFRTNQTCGHHATLAVDIASGVHAQNGSTALPRVLAKETLTMMVLKPGLKASECGEVRVAPLAYLEPFLSE